MPCIAMALCSQFILFFINFFLVNGKPLNVMRLTKKVERELNLLSKHCVLCTVNHTSIVLCTFIASVDLCRFVYGNTHTHISIVLPNQYIETIDVCKLDNDIGSSAPTKRMGKQLSEQLTMRIEQATNSLRSQNRFEY